MISQTILLHDNFLFQYFYYLESQKFFEARGQQQILAGYYDADPKNIVDWLNKTKDVKNIVGVMYTTWISNYKDLEKFVEYVDKWEADQAGK